MEQNIDSRENLEKNSYTIPTAIIIAGAMIVGALLYTRSPAPAPSPSGLPGSSQAQKLTASPEAQALLGTLPGDYVLGNPDASVIIAEFGDFECPFCKKFHDEARVGIVEKYVKTGKVKMVWRHFPLTNIHLNAVAASVASECAGEMGKFWEYHEKLFINQSALLKEDLVRYSGEVGLNTVEFESCLLSGKYEEKVRGQFELGQLLNISGTPTTFINGQPIVGSVPFAQFEAVILNALNN